jgi:hypothetical protein
MFDAVEKAIHEELRWPRSIVERIEAARPGTGLQWAADRIIHWIEATTPDGYEELARLAGSAKDTDPRSLDAVALAEEARRIWYLWLRDVYPQRFVARLYEALTELATGNHKGYIDSLATGVFVAASKENFTDEMLRDLYESVDRLVSGPEKAEG